MSRPTARVNKALPAPGEKAINALVADDVDAVRRLVTKYLECAGYSVVGASNGQELLDAWRSLDGRLDVCVADIDMPIVSGARAIRIMRDEGDLTPSILMSGSSSLADFSEIPGPTKLLQKPFRKADLLLLVDEVTRHHPS